MTIGECCKNPSYMNVNCRYSCGICGPQPKQDCQCRDEDPSCPAEAAKEGGCCGSNSEWMLTNCKKSCAQCGPIKSLPGCPCMNHHEYCARWAGSGECQANPNYMHKFCEADCDMCNTSDN